MLILSGQRSKQEPEHQKALSALLLGRGGTPSFLDSTALSERTCLSQHGAAEMMVSGGWMGNRCHSLTLANEISYSVKILNRTGEASLVVSWLNRCRGPMHTAGRKRPFQFHVWLYARNWKERQSALPQLPSQGNYSSWKPKNIISDH